MFLFYIYNIYNIYLKKIHIFICFYKKNIIFNFIFINKYINILFHYKLNNIGKWNYY